MFGDRYSTAMALDNAMMSNAISMAGHNSEQVGNIAAFYTANMGNPLTASLMQGSNPAMQRQNILDDLQRKHPNPDTPEKLRALASDLSMNGFGDMALTVTNAAIEMEKVEATKAANVISANTPKDTAFSRLTDSLANRVITKDVVHGFLQTSWNDKDGDRYGKVGENFTMDNADENWKRQYDYDYKQAYEQLKGEVQNFSIYKQAQNLTKQELNKLLLDPSAQIEQLKAYIEDLGNTTTSNYLSSVNILAPKPTSKTTSTKNVEAAPSTISFTTSMDEDIMALLNKQ
jgi:hypothetical protein